MVYVYPWTGRPGVADPPGLGRHPRRPRLDAGDRRLPRSTICEFRAQRIEVFGLSAQTTEHHAELIARLAVPFPLLSDAGFAFKEALALPTFEAGGDAVSEAADAVRSRRAHRPRLLSRSSARRATRARCSSWLDQMRRAIADPRD